MSDLSNIDAQQIDSSLDQSPEAVDPTQNLLDDTDATPGADENPAPSKYY